MKKLLLLFATILLSLPVWARQITVNNLIFELDETTLTAEVVGVTSLGESAWFLDIPGKIEIGRTYTVTSIRDYAFCENIDEKGSPIIVTIPETITYIGRNAFFFNRLRELHYYAIDCEFNNYDEETDQYQYTFYPFRYITIGENVKTIPPAFAPGCSFWDLTIPDSVTSIGDLAFYNCGSSFNLKMGNSVTSIGSQAFYGFSGIGEVTIPESVTYIGGGAFYGCSDLYEVSIPESCTQIGPLAFFAPDLSTVYYNAIDCEFDNFDEEENFFYHTFYPLFTDLYIGNKVKTLPNHFVAGSSIRNLTIPNSVTSIEEAAFYNCGSLKSVTIPNSVTSIGRRAFTGCSNLTGINVDKENPSYSSVEGVLYSKNLRTLYCYPAGLSGNMVIPDFVRYIGEEAFVGCGGLTNVTIPTSVISIGDYAFSSCTGLERVIIPSSVESLGMGAFNGCQLSNLVIGCGIKQIGELAIGNQSSASLSNLYITALEAPEVEESNYNQGMFSANIYIPETSFDSYAKAPYFWNEFLYFKDLVSPISFSTSKLEINGRRGTQETFNAVFAPENTTLRYIWVSGYDPEVVSVNWDNASTEINVTILDGDKGTDIIIENLYAANNRTVVKVNGGGTYDPGYGDGDDNGDNAVDNVYGEASQTFDVYTLQGVCVKRSASQSDIDTLSPGLYIIGGKKTVVR